MVSNPKNYSNKNTTLYAFKVLACFSVVALHTWLPLIGGLYQIVARFAVPLFFAITGFYSYQISQDKLKKRLRSILTLTFYSTIFYLVLYLTQYSLSGQLQVYLSQWSLTNTIRFIFFNRISNLVGTATSPLWYLFALIYIYILMYFKSTRLLLTNKIVLLVLLFSAFVLAFLTKDSLYYRNFLFTGVPFVGLGLWLAEVKDKITKSPKTSIVAICLGLVALLLVGLEYLFIGNQYELYVSTVFTVLAILLFSIANPLKVNIPILNKIGRDYATFIFVGHEFVIWLLERILPDSFPHKTEAFSVFILTLALGYFFKKLKHFFQSV